MDPANTDPVNTDPVNTDPVNTGEDAQARTARHSYNRMSKVYAWLSDGSERRFVDEAIGGLLQPQPGEWILEPGFGTGQALAALAELVGPSGRVFGIDVSDGMVDQARKRLVKHGLMDRAELTRGDITDTPYSNGQFDAVFVSFTLELFPDEQIPAVLAEIRRVLKPSGRLCVASMSSSGGGPAMERLYEWSHRTFPTFVDCRPIDAREWIEGAGFTVTVVRPLTMWGLAVDLVLARA